jgi:hypothetical protein
MFPHLGDGGIQFYRPFVKKWFLCNNIKTPQHNHWFGNVVKFQFHYVQLQQLAYSMAMPEPQESADNQYLGNRLLFKLAHQRSFNYQNCIKRITMKRMQVAGP